MARISVSKYELHKKIPPGDPFWPKFNASFANEDWDTDTILNAVYCGHAVTTWHKNHWRSGENYLCGQHLALDFDSEDQYSTLDHLKQDKFIARYGAFIHTTLSHQPDRPRSRVFFLLNTPIMQAKNYTLAAAALLWLYGTADRQCKDAARFFYGAPDCQMVILSNVLPLDVIRKLISDYQDTGGTEKKRAARKNFLPPPSQTEVAEALQFISAWGIPYDEWVQILMGIHSEFGYDGLPLAESWADGRPGEVEQKFRSFKENGNNGGIITIATVFSIAKRFGWRKAKI